MPFWRKEKKNERSVKSQVDLEKYSFMKNLQKNISLIEEKGEFPSFGHAVDFADNVLKDTMRPITKEVYNEGMLHFIVPGFPEVGAILRLDCFKLLDGERIKVEKHVLPNINFFLESTFLHEIESDKKEALVNFQELARQLSVVEPAYKQYIGNVRRENEPLIIFRKMVTVSYKEGLGLNMRIIKFQNSNESSRFLNLTEKNLKYLYISTLVDLTLKDLAKWKSAEEMKEVKKKYFEENKEKLEQTLKKNEILFHVQLDDVNVLCNKEVSLPTFIDMKKVKLHQETSRYTIRFKHNDIIFSIRFAGKDKRNAFELGLVLVRIYSQNRHLLDAK